MSMFLLLAFALIAEYIFRWPDWLFRLIGHPVSWLGRLIKLGDKYTNKGSDNWRFWAGAGLVFLLLLLVGLVMLALDQSLPHSWWGELGRIAILMSLLAGGSLYAHVEKVAHAVDLANARTALSALVSRDSSNLDEASLARAGVETLAENSSDGVVAPLFWGLLLGLPGIALYKAINTMDSMIGYRNEQYEQFGKTAAKLDDLVNLVPARLTALLYWAQRPGLRHLRGLWHGARQHRSPNAGWPELALAQILHIRLSGPRYYDGALHEIAWLHPSGQDANRRDLARGLRHFQILLIQLFLLLLLGAIWLG